MLDNKKYDAGSIKVLRGLDAVRKRPGMYIGDTDDGSGLHHMIYEVVDNAIDEALAGYCSKIHVQLLENGLVSIKDDGRGIPVDLHAEENKSAAYVIMTQLHAGGKFDQNSYKVSGGLHGVGVSVVNALSEYLKLTIWREKKEFMMEFNNGVPKTDLQLVKTNIKQTGTEVTFRPSKEIFSYTDFEYNILASRLEELSFLTGVEIILQDRRNKEEIINRFVHKGGVKEFMEFIARKKELLYVPIVASIEAHNISVDMSMQWSKSRSECLMFYTNTIPQKDGGSHLQAFKSALTRVINKNPLVQEQLKRHKVTLLGEDIREGLVCVLSLKMPDPKFSSQTKDKLVSSEVKNAVDIIVSTEIEAWIDRNPSAAKELIKRMETAAIAREAARKAREIARKKTEITFTSLSGKVADCTEKDPAKRELFIVEGNSAGGSVKLARDRNFQAVLPLRGKILNVEKARFDKVLDYEAIGSLITALGTNIGENFEAEKVKYHKIILMTDADVDGSHIRVLLLTFFFRYMQELITQGYVYIALPPLYGIKKGSNITYLKNDKQLNEYIIKNGLKGIEILSAKNAVTNPIKFVKKMLQFKATVEKLGAVFCNDFLLEHLLLSNAIDYDKKEIDTQMLIKQLNQTNTGEWNQSTASSIYAYVNNVKREYTLSNNIFNHISELIEHQTFLKTVQSDLNIIENGESHVYHSIILCANYILERGKKGFSIQRYKGLGEMRVEDLAKTTLNPKSRTLLKLEINQLESTDYIFSALMGTDVNYRKKFIQSRAVEVNNLDA